MAITLKDVAKKAGVSTATVSYVINNGPRPVSKETRKKVLKAIEELDYKPNVLARGLTTGSTRTTGIIIPDISDPFLPELIVGAEGVAREKGYSVFLCNSNRDPELELKYVDLLTERQVDGLMIAGSRLDTAGLAKVTQSHRIVILSSNEVRGAVTFSIEDFKGGYQIGAYLISLGHREIRYLEGAWPGSSETRYNGLVRALQDHGLPTDDVLAATVSPIMVDASRKCTLSLLERDPHMTALVCWNDVLALGALRACAEFGKRVPEDLSIVGFDDIAESGRTSPPLTTVHVSRRDLGASMMTRLIDEIENTTLSEDRMMVPVRLVKRQSCAAVKTRESC